MSKNNVRIAIRDSTDSHNVAFFDNKAGIKYKSANLQRFLAGSASILTIKYNSKDIDTIRSGCKLAFRYKNRDYWLNVMSFEKKGFEVELTAYSLGLELNNETRGEHKPANAMSIAEYVAYYDPEHALTIGVNEVSEKRIKLEWTGTDTILARLFSVANSFGAELDFSVELNDDYSLKRQVLNIYKKGNLGTNKVSHPVRVGKELKVINYSDNIKELRTAVRATGKDGLTIDGLNKKIYDNNKQLLYYSSGMTVYAPQSRDRFPSVGKGSNDNWIVKDLGETQYETKEALWGYMYGEIQKISVPEITYEVEGAIEAGIGDTQTLIDDIHFEPALYVQARVSELEDDILTGKVTKSTFINFERKYSQIADVLLKQVEALAEDAAPYIIRLSTNNGYIFKNGEGSSTITARLEKYSKDIAATWKWVVDNKVVGTGDKLTVKAEQVTNTMAVTVIAYVNGNEVVRDYMTFSNSDDGVGVESIDRYFTSSDQSDGVTIEGAEWSDKPPAPTEDGKYLWAYDEITYTDGTVTTTKPAAVGANFDVDAFRAEIAEDLKDVPNREEFENKIAEELANSKAEIETQIESAKTQAESNAKEYADTINDETAKVAELANAAAAEIKADLVNVKNNLNSTSLVANNAQAAVDAAKQELAEVNTKVDNAKAELTQTKQQLATVADDLSKAKTDLQNAVSAVDTKATNLKSDLSQAKKDLTSQAQQLQTQANAQSELTKRVSSVEKTANGTKTTVNELSKTVDSNTKNITSVTARTKVVEDDLANTKTTLTQVQTTANSASQKTATLESGLDGLSAKFSSLKVGGRNLIIRSEIQNGYINNEGGLNQGYAFTTNLIDCRNDKQFTITACPVTIVSESQAYRWYRINRYDADKQFIDREIFSYDDNNDKTIKTIVLSDDVSYFSVSFDGSYDEPFKIEKGNIATDYSQNEADLEQKVAEYKQNADQNYASLQTTVQNLDGTVQHNKTVADQTAQGFKTRIESLETYKNGESERANAYFESAKTETAKQLTAERTAIANNYVAKSTYTSDVTGIRNELSATTTTANATKTNLANYQASNDKVVASLKSSLQTTDGNVSNLQTKVEAVPGQITSAVSAVEGKIPTSVGARNYIRNYGLKATGWISLNSGWKFEIISDSTAKSGQYLKATCTTASTSSLNGFYKQLFDFSDGRFFGKQMTWSMDVKTSKNVKLNIGCEWGNAQSNVNVTENWQRFSKTFKVATSSNLKSWVFYSSNWNVGDIVYIRDVQLEDGSIATSPVPAIEDTESDITKLSSELNQTKDGITLLATKTELNTAKSELQSGINTATNKANNAQSTANNNAQTISTHTTQISALNTGLQAKVSQSEFNTLSGRVTTAENNITAKANELSSKITSVEGKIPTSVGGRNLWIQSKATGGFVEETLPDNHITGQKKCYRITNNVELKFNIEPDFSSRLYRKVTFSAWVKYENVVQGENGWNKFNCFKHELVRKNSSTGETTGKDNKTLGSFTGTSDWKYITYTYDYAANKSYDQLKTIIRFNLETARSGTAWVTGVKIEIGSIPSDYSPAPEDTATQISNLSSEIKQTADGMTLLATKTELNTAKNELQSGINTATSKADNAQSTANNNAQTISTHTTQISALNTGLSAKVSQSDFNTLSGRVTTAENNITAKANELSSKITSVENKIPKNAVGTNLYIESKSSAGFITVNSENLGKPSAANERTSDFIPVSKNEKYIFQGWVTVPENGYPWHRYHYYGADKHKIGNPYYFESSTPLAGKQHYAEHITVPDSDSIAYIRVSARLYNDGKLKFEKGNIASDYSLAPDDVTSTQALTQAKSEIKQTTDAIKASVSSLDNSTVKSSSLTINSDGIVMKAGKSTTDVANAIGSYFAVNQNAINLFSDKINVKGNMIVNGAITSDKIASKSINTAHLNGKIITADVISSNAVTADAIKAGAVTTDKMSANSINGDRITAGTLDAAKIKAGSITASQIASGTITSNQIKAGGISSANIAAGAITTDKIAAGAIDANKIAANAITANMIRGGQLNSTNGATVFDLNAGTLTFNNDRGYIQRVASDKVFEITTLLSKDVGSRDYLTSAFNIRKSDNSRQAGVKFTLYNTNADKPTAEANINADAFILYDSQNTRLFSVYGRNTYFGSFNMHGWGDIPIANINGGLVVNDIGIGSHTKSLLKIVEELCKKTGIIWI